MRYQLSVAAAMAVMVVVLGSSANAEAARPGPRCVAPAGFPSFAPSLRRTARRLAHSEPLTVVAIGSSSTAGAGASSSAAAYPARLEAALKAHFPTISIRVLNRGVNGEETRDMMARFARDVFAEHPQLVLWQVGTNSVLRDEPLAEHGAQMRQGLEQLKAAGADVVLIDLQYSPKVLEKTETEGMLDQIALMAKEENVDLFHRFAIMHDWNERQHLPFNVYVAPDQLHMNDWGYACVAKLIAGAIAEAATRPVAAAAAHSGR